MDLQGNVTTFGDMGSFEPGADVMVGSKVIEIKLPTPPIGGKIWVLDRKGIFILERGPGVLRTVACTHFGSGSLRFYDGLPNDNGEFPDEGLDITDARYGESNGRPIYRADPSLMGSWMMDGGFNIGLTVKAMGGNLTTPTIASIVWMPPPNRSR